MPGGASSKLVEWQANVMLQMALLCLLPWLPCRLLGEGEESKELNDNTFVFILVSA